MAIVNVKERADKTVADLTKKIHKALRDAGGCMGDTRTWEKDGVYSIEVENNLGNLGEEMRDLVRKHPHAVYVSHKEYPGQYDWAADVYIKDTTIVEFKF